MEPMVLEEWLRSASYSASSAPSASGAAATTQAAAPQFPASGIVHAWSQLRAFLQQRKALTSADSEPFELLNQHRRSLHLADSQAKLLQGLLSEVGSSDSALLGFVRRFAILGLLAWIRKSFALPNSTASGAGASVRRPAAPEALASIVQSVLKAVEERPVSDQYTSEAILLLGTISGLQKISAAVRHDCLSAVARELVGRREVIIRGGAIASALAGAGYALSVPSQEHLVLPIFEGLLLLWTQNAEVLPSGEKGNAELDRAQTSREQGGSVLQDQIMLLHLMDFLGSIFLSRESSQPSRGGDSQQLGLELAHATLRVLENTNNAHPVQCSSVMASVGLLRSLYRWDQGNRKRGIIPSSSPAHHHHHQQQHKWFTVMWKLQNIVVEICEQAVIPNVEISHTFLADDVSSLQAGNRSLCRCVSAAVSRCRALPPHPSILRCLVFSIFGDALSLDTLYSVFTTELATGGLVGDDGRQQASQQQSASEEEKMLPGGNTGDLGHTWHAFQGHVDGFLLKEIGAVVRVMCDQYRLASGDLQRQTESLVSEYARNLYERHRLLVAVSQASRKEGWSQYRETLEKVLETAFMTIVIFFFTAVGEPVLMNGNGGSEAELAALALDCLSCIEFFRRVRLREFSILVQRSVSHVAASEAASVLLARLLPPQEENIIKKPGTPDLSLTVSWGQNEVQTSRVLFYFRVLPLCLTKMPEATFAEEIAPAMLLYLQHPSETVSKASHALFAAFLSLGVGSDEPPVDFRAEKSQSIPPRSERGITVREQFAVDYIRKALQGFPGLTPFQGLVAGAGAIARHLPPGSPATVYCLSCLVNKTDTLYTHVKQNEGKPSEEGILGKGSDQPKTSPVEEVGAAQRLQILLLHLVLLVDIQVLPALLKFMAKLIIGLPTHYRTVALAEAFDVVGFTNDYTRKPIIVPWLQSLSFLSRRKQTSSKERHPVKDQGSKAPEIRAVKVSNPESVSKSVDVTASQHVVGDDVEEGEQKAAPGSTLRHSGASTGKLGSDQDEAGVDDDKGSEPRSKL